MSTENLIALIAVIATLWFGIKQYRGDTTNTNGDLITKLNTISEELYKARDENFTLKHTNARLLEQVENLKSENTALAKQVKALQDSNSKLNEKLICLVDRVTKLENNK